MQASGRHILAETFIVAIFYPPLKSIWGCFGLILQTWKGNIYFTELAERVEYGKYDILSIQGPWLARETLMTSLHDNIHN